MTMELTFQESSLSMATMRSCVRGRAGFFPSSSMAMRLASRGAMRMGSTSSPLASLSITTGEPESWSMKMLTTSTRLKDIELSPFPCATVPLATHIVSTGPVNIKHLPLKKPANHISRYSFRSRKPAMRSPAFSLCVSLLLASSLYAARGRSSVILVR